MMQWMQEKLEQERKEVRDIWQINCEQISQYDAECTVKDTELVRLEEELNALRLTGSSAYTTQM